MRRLALIILSCSILSRQALAQDLDPAAAEVLFAAGRKAMIAGDYATACAKFAESQRLDPAAGTLINLAECFDKQGKIASAWQKWREARNMLRSGDDRLWAVDDRIKKIEGRLPRLVITMEAGAPVGTVVYRDDVRLGPASFGLALPVDPGAHAVRVEAPGRAVRHFELKLDEGERTTLHVAPGEPLPAAAAASAEPAGVSAAPPPVAPAPAPAPADEKPTPSTPWVGFVIGGVGAAALGVGAVAGILAASEQRAMDENCRDVDGDLFCNDIGLEAADSGSTLATVANIGVAAGIVGLGIGAYLVLTHDDGTQTSLSARPVARGLEVSFARAF